MNILFYFSVLLLKSIKIQKLTTQLVASICPNGCIQYVFLLIFKCNCQYLVLHPFHNVSHSSIFHIHIDVNSGKSRMKIEGVLLISYVQPIMQ